MAETKKHIRVFLASPGDLAEERRAAKTTVDCINKMFSDFEGYHIDLVGWEDTLPQYGRAQAVINQDLETCELFIGMLWERWGTPPAKDGTYSSGFEEEFKISIASRRASGRPEMCLFLKDMDAKLIRDPGDDAKKIIDFKNKLIAEREIKFDTFRDVREFETKLQLAIVGYLQKIIKEDRQRKASENQSTPADTSSSDSVPTPAKSLLSPEGASFLRGFVSRVETEEGSSHITSVEVARFRLLGQIVSRLPNDENTLGAHDANLLFAERHQINFGEAEIAGLVDVGLEHIKSENVPLWHWYAESDGFKRPYLAFHSLFRGLRRQTGALNAMTLINEALPKSSGPNRERFLDIWFADEAQSNRKVAALEYLSEAGIADDLPKITEELGRGDYQTRGAALEAIVRIGLRTGREKALAALFELQTDFVDARLVKLLFDKPESFGNEILIEGLLQRSEQIRRACAIELAKRRKLSTENAEKLLSDNDVDIRLLAISTFTKSGRVFSEDEGKRILIHDTQLGGLLGTKVGEKQFETFRIESLASKSDQVLEESAARLSVFERDAELVLFERRYSKYRDRILTLIENRYKDAFDEAIKKMIMIYGDESQLVKDIKGLEDYLRQKFARQALIIVCRKAGVSELSFIRKALEDESFVYDLADVEYLAKCGEWQDISLIISLLKRYDSGGSLLGMYGEERYQLAADAIHRIGKGRVAELLAIHMPASLLSKIIYRVSDADFDSLDDDTIQTLCLKDDESVRKITVLKCVRSFSKVRLTRILNAYTDGDNQRYYNVIYWLDLGVSAPRAIASRAAAKVIAREWVK